ncbi:hypothetical protein HOG98_04120 [bacterium]|jgi:hypothetical protein|nr:hypothetical protein [bacterium]
MAKKRVYKKGMELFHSETKEKIVFGKWNDDGSAGCITKKHTFINLERSVIDSEYTAYYELERDAKKKRSGQSW